MNKALAICSLCTVAVASTALQAQDVVVMRRVLMAPRPRITPTPTPEPSLIVNGNFSNGFAGWNMGAVYPTRAASIMPTGGEDGSPAAFIDGTIQGGQQISQFPTADPSKTYVASMRLRYTGAKATVDIYEYNTGKTLASVSGASSANKWITLSGTFKPNAKGEVAILFRFNGTGGAGDLASYGTYTVDDIKLTVAP